MSFGVIRPGSTASTESAGRCDTGGNASFGADAPIIAQSNVRRRLAAGSRRRNGDPVAPAVKPALPVITFDESLSIHFNGGPDGPP